MSIQDYIILFIFYSIFGWVMEVIKTLIDNKKFVNRGFLIGPWCPIYGNGAILVTLLLQEYTDDIIILFFMSVIICEALEYLTSYLMEKIFLARWWDYSNRKYNINGRICLETAIPFGLLCCVMMKILNPSILDILHKLEPSTLNIIVISLVLIYLVDNIMTYCIVFKIRGKFKNSLKDSTEEITREVKEFIIKENKLFQKRLLKAFPNLKLLKEIKKRIKKLS